MKGTTRGGKKTHKIIKKIKYDAWYITRRNDESWVILLYENEEVACLNLGYVVESWLNQSNNFEAKEHEVS